MLIIPTLAVPSQTLQTSLMSQNTRLNIYQHFYGVMMDVLLDESPIIQGVLCENLNLIIRDAYLGYQGDFAWIDSEGTDDPVYTGIGTRYALAWLSPTDLQLAAAGVAPPSTGITGGIVPASGGSPVSGAPTQLEPSGPRVGQPEPFKISVSNAFNGYQAGAQIYSGTYVDLTSGQGILWTSQINNNANNPDDYPPAPGLQPVQGWVPSAPYQRK